MSEPRVHAGTSGFSYKEWKGAFYPADLPASRFLEYYASQLSTVEINNTFYRFPRASLLEGWRDGTPDGFTFAVKAHSGITHKSRLRDAGDFTADFVERCRVLGGKLGPVLFQLPPNFKRDDERLADFVDVLPPGPRFAMEFRHVSWFDDEVFQQLRRGGVALCVSEADKLDTPRVATADFVYVRLRKDDYPDAELADWSRWFDEQVAEDRDVFVYLKHDEAGSSPERALRLLRGD